MAKQFILLMSDTTRCDMIGAYGHKAMSTPNLDRLAEEGVRFTEAYCAQPVCGPARSALFTGQFPHSNGVIANCLPLGDNVKTIGQRLSDQGIHCGYIGKWHLDGFDYFGNGRCPEGFDADYWYDMRCYLEELDESWRRRSRRSETSFDEDFDETMTSGYRVASRAVDFIEQFGKEDFFLTVSFDEPHGPSLTPAPFNTMYEGVCFEDNPNYADDLSDKPLMQQLWAGEGRFLPADHFHRPTAALSLFLGCNSFMDAMAGRVLEAIERCCPEAVVMFTSDHGDLCGNHKLQTKNGVAYREVANIPWIIRDHQHRGVRHALVSHVDFVPGVLEYFGLGIPRLLEGKSFWPLVREEEAVIHEAVFVEFGRYEVDHDGFGGLQLMRSAFDGRMKLVLHLCDTDELYDVRQDPGEVVNLIDDPRYARQRNHLHDLILQHMNDTRDVFRGYCWAVRKWRTDLVPSWSNDGYTRQRENEEYEPRQLDYDTGMPMENAVRRKKIVDEKL